MRADVVELEIDLVVAVHADEAQRLPVHVDVLARDPGQVVGDLLERVAGEIHRDPGRAQHPGHPPVGR